MLFTHKIRTLMLKAANRWLSLDPDSQERLQALEGKILRIEIEGMTPFDLTFADKRVDLFDSPVDTSDAHIFLTFGALSTLIQRQGKLLDLIREGVLDIQGDLSLAQAFAKLCQHCRPDIEEYLSDKIGDVAAHTLASGVRTLTQKLKDKRQQQRATLKHALFDAWQMAPTQDELDVFYENIKALEHPINTLEARVIRLQQKVRACN